MGKTFSTGLLTNGLWQDASNNIGIGGSPSGSYKLEVTGTGRFSGELSTTSGLLSISGAGGGPPTGGVGFRFVSNRLIVYGGSSDITFQKNSNAGANMTILESGQVGIGTSSPSSLLHLGVANAAVDGTKGVKITNPAGTTVMLECGVSSDSFVGTTSGSDFSIRTNNSERMRITSAGSVGINGTPPSTVKLGVFGASATSSDYAFACYTNVGGNLIYVRNDGFLFSVSAWSGSDRRLKENITDLDNGLEKVLGLKARKYDLIDSFKNQFGFIAQEVQEVIPDAVSVFQEEDQMLAIKMDFIVPHLVKAVQELSAQNQELKSRLDKAGL